MQRDRSPGTKGAFFARRPLRARLRIISRRKRKPKSKTYVLLTLCCSFGILSSSSSFFSARARTARCNRTPAAFLPEVRLSQCMQFTTIAIERRHRSIGIDVHILRCFTVRRTLCVRKIPIYAIMR